MPRKPAKTSETNTMDAIDQAINTPVNLQFCEVCEELGISDPQLRERLEAKTGDANVHLMDSIPCEWEPHIKSIRLDLEAERSTRKLEAQETPQLPEASEPPLLEEEVQPKKRGGRGKKATTALTQKKTESLKNSDQKSQQLAVSDVQIKQALHVKKGQKSGAQLATLELAAEDATYRSIKGQALVRKVAQLSSELAGESDFDPIQILKDAGIEPNDEILETLREQIEPTLGKFETAVEEITANAWVNGIDLGTEFTHLESLLSSNN